MANLNENDVRIVANLLKKIDLFKDLNEKFYMEIISHVTLDYLPENYIVFQENDDGDCMYFIKTGSVKVFHPGISESFDTELAILNEGDFFGEMALISEEPRNASVKTIEPTELFIFKKNDFLNLISENSEIAEVISSEFLDRMKENLRGKTFN